MDTFLKYRKYIILFYLSTFFSCRKSAQDFNPDLVGFWVNTDYCQDQIRIEENGHGIYTVVGGSMECKSAQRASGPTKCWDNVFRIDKTKFFILDQPTSIDTIDSIKVEPHILLYKSVMSMVLKKRFWDGGRSYTFYKLIGK